MIDRKPFIIFFLVFYRYFSTNSKLIVIKERQQVGKILYSVLGVVSEFSASFEAFQTFGDRYRLGKIVTY